MCSDQEISDLPTQTVKKPKSRSRDGEETHSCYPSICKPGLDWNQGALLSSLEMSSWRGPATLANTQRSPKMWPCCLHLLLCLPRSSQWDTRGTQQDRCSLVLGPNDISQLTSYWLQQWPPKQSIPIPAAGWIMGKAYCTAPVPQKDAMNATACLKGSQELWRCGLRNMVNGHGGDSLTVGLDDLCHLFQP